MAKEQKTCPRCGTEGTVEKLFGYRARLNCEGLTVYASQPWCTPCRGAAARQTAKNKKNPKYVKPSQKRKVVGIDKAKGKDKTVIAVYDRATLKLLYAEHFNDKQSRSVNFMTAKLVKKGVINANPEREFAKLGNL